MKKIYLFIFVLALGCQEAYDFCEVHEIFDDCSPLLPEDPDVPIDEQPYYEQSIACGGAGNTVADEDLAWQWIAYTDTTGAKVIGHRMLFKDSTGTTLFTSKFGNYEINDTDKKGYIVDYDNPDKELYYKLELMEIQDIADSDMKLYLFHQEVEAPGIDGNPNWATNIYPQSPVKIEECEDWAEVGDLKGIVIE